MIWNSFFQVFFVNVKYLSTFFLKKKLGKKNLNLNLILIFIVIQNLKIHLILFSFQ